MSKQILIFKTAFRTVTFLLLIIATVNGIDYFFLLQGPEIQDPCHGNRSGMYGEVLDVTRTDLPVSYSNDGVRHCFVRYELKHSSSLLVETSVILARLAFLWLGGLIMFVIGMQFMNEKRLTALFASADLSWIWRRFRFLKSPNPAPSNKKSDPGQTR